MAKGKPRWEPVSPYELAKKVALGEATPAEREAAKQASAARLGGRRPNINIVGERIVVR